jgi:NAD(P)-dependent dehydrogenase (short-subunit alcohol dehydrogenase family)
LQKLSGQYGKDRLAVLQLDLASPESIENAAAESAKLLPEGLDCLVGNAGANDQPVATFENLCVLQFKTPMMIWSANQLIHRDTKLFADELILEVVNNTILIRSFLPLIRKGTPGRLVFMSSVIGSVELAAGMPMLADAYAVSRAALNMLVRKWGGALKYEGIATALVHPGV